PNHRSHLSLHDALPISGNLFTRPHLDERRIVIQALPGQNIPVIKAGRIALEMPLADDGGVITGLLQCFGDRPLTAVEFVEHRYRSEEHTSELQSRENLV